MGLSDLVKNMGVLLKRKGVCEKPGEIAQWEEVLTMNL